MILIDVNFIFYLGWKTNLNSVKDHLNTVAATQVDLLLELQGEDKSKFLRIMIRRIYICVNFTKYNYWTAFVNLFLKVNGNLYFKLIDTLLISKVLQHI